MRFRIIGHVFWCAFGNYLAAFVPSFGTKVDEVVGAFDEVEVVLDDDDSVAAVDEFLQYVHEVGHIVIVEPDCWLVEQVHGLLDERTVELACDFHTLSLATGERGRVLSDFYIRKADVHKRLQAVGDGRNVTEEFVGLLHRHFQDIIHIFFLVFYFQCFFVKALTIAHVAGHVDCREKMHFHSDESAPLTGLASAAFDIERKPIGLPSAQACLFGLGKHVADMAPRARIGGDV